MTRFTTIIIFSACIWLMGTARAEDQQDKSPLTYPSPEAAFKDFQTAWRKADWETVTHQIPEDFLGHLCFKRAAASFFTKNQRAGSASYRGLDEILAKHDLTHDMIDNSLRTNVAVIFSTARGNLEFDRKGTQTVTAIVYEQDASDFDESRRALITAIQDKAGFFVEISQWMKKHRGGEIVNVESQLTNLAMNGNTADGVLKPRRKTPLLADSLEFSRAGQRQFGFIEPDAIPISFEKIESGWRIKAIGQFD